MRRAPEPPVVATPPGFRAPGNVGAEIGLSLPGMTRLPRVSPEGSQQSR
jgi:hypothetical protein